MIQIASGDDTQVVEVGGQRLVPGTLPVLPLRETVPLPETLMPLAVAQPPAVRKSAGPDEPATPVVVCKTMLPERCVVTWNGDFATAMV